MAREKYYSRMRRATAEEGEIKVARPTTQLIPKFSSIFCMVVMRIFAGLMSRCRSSFFFFLMVGGLFVVR